MRWVRHCSQVRRPNNAESPFVPVDGEMYWNAGVRFNAVDGHQAAHRHGPTPRGLLSIYCFEPELNDRDATKFVDAFQQVKYVCSLCLL